jgi:ABC-2 type transport system ATP-binding protein
MPLQAFRELPGVIDAREEDGRVLLSASAVHRAVPALLSTLDGARARLALLTTHSATLEDVFVKLTGRHLRDA